MRDERRKRGEQRGGERIDFFPDSITKYNTPLHVTITRDNIDRAIQTVGIQREDHRKLL